MSWEWSGKQILSLFAWVALLLYVLEMVRKAFFFAFYMGRAAFVCPGDAHESRLCRYLRGSRLFCMSWQWSGKQILSLFMVIAFNFVISGRAWEAYFVAIYGDRAHFCDFRASLGS